MRDSGATWGNLEHPISSGLADGHFELRRQSAAATALSDAPGEPKPCQRFVGAKVRRATLAAAVQILLGPCGDGPIMWTLQSSPARNQRFYLKPKA